MPHIEFLILCDGIQNRWDLRKKALELDQPFWVS